VSEQSGGDGWWLASDGRWYPPESIPTAPPPPRSPIVRRSAGGHWDVSPRGWRFIIAGSVLLLVLVGGATFGVLYAAQNNPHQEYLDGVRSHAPSMAARSDADLLQAGRSACSLLINEGGNLDRVAKVIEAGTTDDGGNPNAEVDAAIIVQQAAHHLCTQFAGEAGQGHE
jgi:hypothetical protein